AGKGFLDPGPVVAACSMGGVAGVESVGGAAGSRRGGASGPWPGADREAEARGAGVGFASFRGASAQKTRGSARSDPRAPGAAAIQVGAGLGGGVVASAAALAGFLARVLGWSRSEVSRIGYAALAAGSPSGSPGRSITVLEARPGADCRGRCPVAVPR